MKLHREKIPPHMPMNKIYRSDAEAQQQRIEEAWGSLNWLAGRGLHNSENLTLGRVVIKAGHFNPKHSHPNCDEVLYLLQGKLMHVIGDQTYIMEPGDTTLAPANVSHLAFSIGKENADMIVAYSSGTRELKKETD